MGHAQFISFTVSLRGLGFFEPTQASAGGGPGWNDAASGSRAFGCAAAQGSEVSVDEHPGVQHDPRPTMAYALLLFLYT